MSLPSLDTLNRYSGLLQVIIGVITAAITVGFVILTWRNLKAFERSTRSGRESEHLNAIKLQVVAPILFWIDEVFELLEGRGSRNIIGVRTVEEPNVTSKPFYISEMVLAPDNLSFLLFQDAAKNHFPDQLDKFASAVTELDRFFRDVAEFARRCSTDLEKQTQLPRPKFNDRSFDCFDIELFVQVCLRLIPQGVKVEWFPQPGAAPGCVAVVFNGTQPAVAQDSQTNLDNWMPQAIQYVKAEWSDSDLSHRMKLLHKRFSRLQMAIREVELFQKLPGTCKYLGE